MNKSKALNNVQATTNPRPSKTKTLLSASQKVKPAQKTHRIGAPSGDHGAPGGLETLSPIRYDPKKTLKQQMPQQPALHQVSNQLPSGSRGNRV